MDDRGKYIICNFRKKMMAIFHHNTFVFTIMYLLIIARCLMRALLIGKGDILIQYGLRAAHDGLESYSSLLNFELHQNNSFICLQMERCSRSIRHNALRHSYHSILDRI